MIHLLVFDRGSRGPSTVTLIALVYVATWGGVVDTVMVMLKLFPVTENGIVQLVSLGNIILSSINFFFKITLRLIQTHINILT